MKVGLVHATLAAVQPMVETFRKHAPQAALMHFLDEGLLPLVNRTGLNEESIGEMRRLIARAVASGAEGVLLSCSAYSPCVPELRAAVPVPVVSVDETMLRQAIALGRRIGVVATVPAAGPTTARLLEQFAAETGLQIDVRVRVTPEAFTALNCGEGARHDALVRAEIEALVPECEVVVLAQISMARAIEGVSGWAKPVLTSPETSIRALLAELSALRA
jgi:Asp/Glu/hydantoin racemase